MPSPRCTVLILSGLLGLASACAEPSGDSSVLSQTIGPEGGVLLGDPEGAFAGVEVVIPAGALDESVEISIQQVEEGDRPLPETAHACGPMFALEPSGLVLAEPAEVTLPFDGQIVSDELRLPEEVKVWVQESDAWGREVPFETTGSTVSIELGALAVVAAGVNPPEDIVRFSFTPNAAFESCMARYPGDDRRRPQVDAVVVSGEGADTMWLFGRNIAPGLGFDLFTIERSPLDAYGDPVPGFPGFGMSWYQADLEANRWGRVYQVIRTVLLDEPFGLVADSVSGFPPTRTFHAGFWFTDPADAAACGFAGEPTPFNGEQQAGPLAMVTLPDEQTGLGPLCTDPESCTE